MVEFIILLLSLSAMASIVFYSLKTGISPMPSSKAAIIAFEKEIEAQHLRAGKVIYECGAGWGGLAFALASRFPELQIIAFECSLIPLGFMKLKQVFIKAQNLEIRQDNFLEANFREASILTCYLCRSLMGKIEKKWLMERAAGAILISNSFTLPGLEVEREVRLKGFLNDALYIYKG